MTTRTPTQDPQSPQQSPLRHKLLQLYDVLSNKIAGGQRVDHRSLMPGADDPAEGMIPDSMSSQLGELDWFSPADWAGLGAGDAPWFDITQIPESPSTGIDGDGMDFYRSGEAPDNYTNRNNPLYKTRAEFIERTVPKLTQWFGVSGYAGHYREPKASDKDPGGPSGNSDHYSAGAVDFSGTPEQLDKLREYLVDQPWVSFIRWRSESHFDHLHVSFDLGWIARNYGGEEPFTKPTAPLGSTVPKPPAPTPPTMTISPESTPTPAPHDEVT